MGLPVRVVSHPDPDYKSADNERLWVLVGGADHCDGATAFYIGPDRDQDGDDIAGGQLDDIRVRASKAGLEADLAELEEALRDYRRARGTSA